MIFNLDEEFAFLLDKKEIKLADEAEVTDLVQRLRRNQYNMEKVDFSFKELTINIL